MAQAFFRLPLALPSPIGRCAVRTLISRRGLPLKCPQHAHQAVSSAGPAVLSRPTVPFKVPVVAGTQRHLQVSASAQGKVVPFLLADIGEAIAEVELVEWHVDVGDTIEEFQKVCLVESDKASVDITSRFAGKVIKLHYEVGEMAKTGSALCDIEVEDDADLPDDVAEAPTGSADAPVASEGAAVTAPPVAPATTPAGKKLIMTPAVRRLVKEHNIDLNLVTATGKDNRVLKEDVLNYLEGGQAEQPAQPLADPAFVSPEPAPVQRVVPLEEDKVVPIKGLQRTMVKTMMAAASVPVFGYADECDVTTLVQVRKDLKGAAEERGIKLSYLPFMMKAVSLALRKYPILNSHVNADCTEMVYKAEHNISLAMQTPNGLLVPNVKNCEARSVLEIAEELNRLQTVGMAGRLGPDDLKGGTFALSNIGVVGGTYCTPILVVPQVVIGALGGMRKVPRYDDAGNVVPVTVMEVSWTADHRVIDGVTMAEFSNLWKSYLANPSAMLLELR